MCRPGAWALHMHQVSCPMCFSTISPEKSLTHAAATGRSSFRIECAALLLRNSHENIQANSIRAVQDEYVDIKVTYKQLRYPEGQGMFPSSHRDVKLSSKESNQPNNQWYSTQSRCWMVCSPRRLGSCFAIFWQLFCNFCTSETKRFTNSANLFAQLSF